MKGVNISKAGVCFLLATWIPQAVAADEWVPVGSTPQAVAASAEAAPADKQDTWIDRQHGSASSGIDKIARHLDSWFGTPDPNRPADAGLRVILDTEWNKYDEFSVKPRIRGRLKLPKLEEHLSVVFGDDTLDNQLSNPAHLGADGRQQNDPDRTYNSRRVRDDNASLALRWSDIDRYVGMDTDFDLGLRSGDDIFARVKVNKGWQLDNNIHTFAEQIYRYGIDSKHYARTNLEVRHAVPAKPFIANHLHFQYENDYEEEEWS